MELVSSGRGMKVGGDLLKLESRFVCLPFFFLFSLLSCAEPGLDKCEVT